uniref:SH3_10 domain-containing protein n=1 Tax=Echinostoma caproni TaxID=27848 RepID=A0A183ANE4_9TREM
LIKLVSTNKELANAVARTEDPMSSDALAQIESSIRGQLSGFMELSATARQLSLQSRVVAPLHYRTPLPEGRHSANLLASIRLSSDSWLHRGDPVRVWKTSTIASDLLHEWAAETPDGTQATTLPAACLWLTSPESSPPSSTREHASRITVYTGQAEDGVVGQQQMKHLETEDAGDEGDSTSNQSDERRSRRKQKPRVNLFSNNKAAAARFQTMLFGAWTDTIGDWAALLIPTYHSHLESLLKFKGDIKTTRKKEMEDLKSELPYLVDYGDVHMRKALHELRARQIIQTVRDDLIQPDELLQLLKTLDAWNKLRIQLLDARKAASPRSLSHEALKSAQTAQARRLHSFDVRTVSDSRTEVKPQMMEVTYPLSTEREISQIEELVTSFAEPAPRTYRVLTEGKAQFVEAEHAIPDHELHPIPIPSKRAQSQPAKSSKAEKKDLMTQINTPYIPTLVHCPKCDLEYEVDLYRSPNDVMAQAIEPIYYQTRPGSTIGYSPRFAHTKQQNGTGRLVSEDLSTSTANVRPADSMPALSTAQEIPKYITADSSVSSRSRAAESGFKLRKRLGRWNKHRPHSFSTVTGGGITTPGLTDTTGSSGIDSLPATPTLEESAKRSRHGRVKKSADKSRPKTGGISIFRWGRKRKATPESISPGTESVGTEPGPSEVCSPLMTDRHSALHVQTELSQPDSNATLTDQETPQAALATPIIRSRSWIQHGTPWGYGPPLHEHWHPSTEYVITQERPRVQYAQSHSERLRNKAARPRIGSGGYFASVDSDHSLSVDYSPTHQLMDSGIQTDTDLTAGMADVKPKRETKQTQVGENKRSQELCAKCQVQTKLYPPIHQAVQCGVCATQLTQIGVGVDNELTKIRQSSVSCQVGIDVSPKPDRVQVWDVSCQIGMLKRNQGTDMDQFKLQSNYPVEKENLETNAVATQTIPDAKSCLVESFGYRKQPRMLYSTSCQVGQIVRTIASGPEHLEAVQLLDESIERYATETDNPSPRQACTMVGKKLQVGKPWSDDLRPVVQQSSALSNEVVCTADRSQGSPKPPPKVSYTECEVQTNITGEVIPYKRPNCERCIQTDCQLDHDQQESKSHVPALVSGLTKETNQTVMCADSTWRILRGPAMSDVSTMVGRQTTVSQQQTELNAQEVETALRQMERASKSVITHAMHPKQKQAEQKLHVLDDKVESRPAVCTRAKRIQKGSPMLHSTSSDKQLQVTCPKVEEEKRKDLRSGRPLRSQRRCYQRVVVNVGLYDTSSSNSGGGGGGLTRKSLFDYKYPDQTTGSSMSDTEDVIETTARPVRISQSSHGRCISVPSKSVSMCFHFDRQPECCENKHQGTKLYQKHKRHNNEASDPHGQRSWSFDDLRTCGSNWEKTTTVEENDTHYVWTESSDRGGIQLGNCPGIERSASGARRRIDQLRNRHENYPYHY